MKKLAKNITYIVVMSLIIMVCSSCKLTKLPESVKVGNVVGIELKGLSAIELKVEFKNDSRYRLKMEDAEVAILVNGIYSGRLIQVGEATSEPKSEGVVTTVWKIREANPLALFSLASRVRSGDFAGVAIDYTTKLSANRMSRTISDKNVELTKFFSIFAK